jgi:hypothetical protein|tara:strand:- start:12355 stop:12678 length:324 start_codon:yes stop_codon:yes gene_type:complete
MSEKIKLKDNEVILESKRKVALKEMSIDDMDYCADLTVVRFENGEATGVGNMNKARTAWLRRGIKGGDFKSFKMDGDVVADSVLRQLKEDEKNELSIKIQDYQRLGE